MSDNKMTELPTPHEVVSEPEEAVVEAPEVQIVFKKKSEPTVIEIDPDALTWGDNLKFAKISEQMENGTLSESEGMNALNELISKVVGQDINELPARVVVAIMAQMGELAGGDVEDRKNSD